MSEEELDEVTERAIGEYGSECYEVGFQDAEGDQVVADVARQAREKTESALRARIRQVVADAVANAKPKDGGFTREDVIALRGLIISKADRALIGDLDHRIEALLPPEAARTDAL